MSLSVIIGVAISYLLLIIGAVFFLSKFTEFPTARRRFYSGIKNIIEHYEDDLDCANQIELLFKRLFELFPALKSRNINTPIDMLTDIIYAIDTFPEHLFRKRFGFVPPGEQRVRIANILKILQEKYPFSTISNKEAQLLNSLKNAIDSNNIPLADSILSRLTNEIETLENEVFRQSKKSQSAYSLTVISTVLTIVFGLIGLVPLLGNYFK